MPLNLNPNPYYCVYSIHSCSWRRTLPKPLFFLGFASPGRKIFVLYPFTVKNPPAENAAPAFYGERAVLFGIHKVGSITKTYDDDGKLDLDETGIRTTVELNDWYFMQHKFRDFLWHTRDKWVRTEKIIFLTKKDDILRVEDSGIIVHIDTAHGIAKYYIRQYWVEDKDIIKEAKKNNAINMWNLRKTGCWIVEKRDWRPFSGRTRFSRTKKLLLYWIHEWLELQFQFQVEVSSQVAYDKRVVSLQPKEEADNEFLTSVVK